MSIISSMGHSKSTKMLSRDQKTNLTLCPFLSR